MKISIIFILLSIAGCATTANYEKILQTYVGHDADELVTNWGPPANSYEMKNGSKVITFMSINGSTSQYIGNGLVVSTQHYCKTDFIVDSANVIQSWQWEGNACRADAPEETPVVQTNPSVSRELAAKDFNGCTKGCERFFGNDKEQVNKCYSTCQNQFGIH